MVTPRTTLITGAASGIGRCFAETLAARGDNLVLWDVDAAALEPLGERLRQQHIRVVTAPVDVGARDAAERALAADPTSADRIDLLINCAAVLGAGEWLKQQPERFEQVVRVDLLGTVNTIRAALPGLRRARGRVVILASTAAVHGWPQLAAYAAAKFALVGFADSVRAELRRDGIGLTTVFPLLIDTPLLNRPGTPPILRRGRRLPPELVVRKVLAAAARGTRRVYIPGSVRVIAALHALAPSLLDWWGERVGMER